MKDKLKLWVVFGLVGLLAFLAPAANVLVNVRDITGQQVANRTVTITLVTPDGPVAAGSWVFAGDHVSKLTDQFGQCVFSNLQAVGDYRLDIAGYPSRSFPFSLDSSATGSVSLVSILDYFGTNATVQKFYTTDQIDALLAGLEFDAARTAAVTNAAKQQAQIATNDLAPVILDATNSVVTVILADATNSFRLVEMADATNSFKLTSLHDATNDLNTAIQAQLAGFSGGGSTGIVTMAGATNIAYYQAKIATNDLNTTLSQQQRDGTNRLKTDLATSGLDFTNAGRWSRVGAYGGSTGTGVSLYSTNDTVLDATGTNINFNVPVAGFSAWGDIVEGYSKKFVGLSGLTNSDGQALASQWKSQLGSSTLTNVSNGIGSGLWNVYVDPSHLSNSINGLSMYSFKSDWHQEQQGFFGWAGGLTNDDGQALASEWKKQQGSTTLTNLSLGNGVALTNLTDPSEINVTHSPWNAKGDTNTDNSTALQNVINYAVYSNGAPKRIKFPTGVYKFGTRLIFPPSSGDLGTNYGWSIAGDGVGSSVLWFTGNGTSAIDIQADTAQGRPEDLTLRDFTLSGRLVRTGWDATETGTTGIRVGGPTYANSGQRVTFQNLRIEGFQKGILCSNIWSPLFLSCNFVSNRLVSVQCSPCYSPMFQRCTFKGGELGRESDNFVIFDLGTIGASGVIGQMLDCTLTLATNAIIQKDLSVTYLGCYWERVGSAIFAVGAAYADVRNCDFGDLWAQSPGEGAYMTNNNMAWFKADGVAARGFTFHNLFFEDDASTSRSLFWSYPTNYTVFSWNGLYPWKPRVSGGLADNWKMKWGLAGQPLTNMIIYRDALPATMMDMGFLGSSYMAGFKITNSSSIISTPALQIINGSDQGNTLVLGADANVNTLTANANKSGSLGWWHYIQDGNGAFSPVSGLSWDAFDGYGVMGIGGNTYNPNFGPWRITFHTAPLAASGTISNSVEVWRINTDGSLEGRTAGSGIAAGWGAGIYGINNLTNANGKALTDIWMAQHGTVGLSNLNGGDGSALTNVWVQGQIVTSALVGSAGASFYGQTFTNRLQMNQGGALWTSNNVNVGNTLSVGGQTWHSNTVIGVVGGADFISGTVTNRSQLNQGGNVWTTNNVNVGNVLSVGGVTWHSNDVNLAWNKTVYGVGTGLTNTAGFPLFATDPLTNYRSIGANLSSTLYVGGALWTTNTVNIGTDLRVGGQEYSSNTVIVTAGGLDVQSGTTTNRGQVNMGGPLYLTNAATLYSSASISNGLTIVTNGLKVSGIQTNVNTTVYVTNAFGWGPVDCSIPIQFTAFGSNYILAGLANIDYKNGNKFITLFSNAGASPITITLPSYTALLGANVTNQPLTTLTVTNGKIGRLDWLLYPHLGGVITSAVYYPQIN